MKNIKEHSSNSSDSDDWTLLTPPHGSSSCSPSSSDSASPERDQLVSSVHEEFNRTQTSSNVTQEELPDEEEDDGLTDIDLNDQATTSKSSLSLIQEKNNPINQEPCQESERSSSTELEVIGFHPIDTTSDEEQNNASSESRRSSLTQSELNDYVDLGKIERANSATNLLEELDTNLAQREDANTSEVITAVARVLNQSQQTDRLNQTDCLSLIKVKLDQLNDAVTTASNRRDIGSRIIFWLSCLSIKHWIILVLLLASNVLIDTLTVKIYKNYQQQTPDQAGNDWRKYVENTFDGSNLVDSIPSSHYLDLKLLHSELTQCIKRQNPASFKYYMTEERFRETENPSIFKISGDNTNFRTYKGLVCYGQETQWRKRFDKLKYEYNLDLRRLMQEAKRRVTNDMLEAFHPALQFKLILNQIEYLDFLEIKRHKKQSDETIKHLKSENLQLLHKLNKPMDTGYQRLMVNLEVENSKLKRENEALKSNLVQKAGPIYIKQSNDLEKFERENIILKQFHFHVAQEISKSLKQFNLHTIDASSTHDGHESLNSQLMLTRGYLRKLSDKISTVLLENDSLKEELKQIYMVGPINQDNLPAINKLANNNQHYSTRNENNSNALTDETCMRDLTNLKAKAKHLENENARLKSDCLKNKSDLEQYNTERHLNKTNCETNGQYENNWRRLGPIVETGVDLPKDVPSTSNQAPDKENDIVDDIYLLLTKFSNQIESGLARVIDIEHESLQTTSQRIHETGILLKEVALDIADKADKVIPNYIREAFRTVKSNTYDNEQDSTITSNENNIKLPPAPPIQFTDSTSSTSNHTDDSSFNENDSELTISPTSETSCHEPDMQVAIDENQENLFSLNTDEAESEEMEYSGMGVLRESTKDKKRKNSWFFKRAKQRKQLRNHKDSSGIRSDWLLKRAKLREKLRKASSDKEIDFDQQLLQLQEELQIKIQQALGGGKKSAQHDKESSNSYKSPNSKKNRPKYQSQYEKRQASMSSSGQYSYRSEL